MAGVTTPYIATAFLTLRTTALSAAIFAGGGQIPEGPSESSIRLTVVIPKSASFEVRTLLKIQTALERAGVEFIPADATKGPGVRLAQSGGASRTKTQGRSKRSG